MMHFPYLGYKFPPPTHQNDYQVLIDKKQTELSLEELHKRISLFHITRR